MSISAFTFLGFFFLFFFFFFSSPSLPTVKYVRYCAGFLSVILKQQLSVHYCCTLSRGSCVPFDTPGPLNPFDKWGQSLSIFFSNSLKWGFSWERWNSVQVYFVMYLSLFWLLVSFLCCISVVLSPRTLFLKIVGLSHLW